MMNVVAVAIAIVLFDLAILGQKPSVSPTPGTRPVTEMRLSFPSLKDELSRSDVEPRVGKFRMNARFARAKFSKPAFTGADVFVYRWDYYPEATVMLKFFQTPVGTFPKAEPERLRLLAKLLDSTIKTDLTTAEKQSEKDIRVDGEIGREASLLIKGQPAIVRSWSREDIWYLMLVVPKRDDAQPLIEQLFNSFKFEK